MSQMRGFSACPRPGVFLAGLILLAAAVGSGCSKDDGNGNGARRVVPLGVEANEVRGAGGDPGMAETFMSVHQGSFAAAQIALDWTEIEPERGERDWQNLDPILTQVSDWQLRLSLRLLLIDSGARGRFPPDLEGENFPGWDDQRLVARLVPLLRDLASRLERLNPRGEARLTHVWIGSEVDSYFSEHRGELPAFRRLLAMCRDSLEVPGASLKLGTILTYTGAPVWPGMADSLANAGSRLGLDIYGRDQAYAWALSPSDLMARVREGVARFSGVPVVLTGVGFPSSAQGDAGQGEFAGLLLAYLADPPGHLDSAFWFSLHDWNSVAAQELAARRFPQSPALAQAYAAELLHMGLRQVSGVAKPVWAEVTAWNQEHAGLWSALATGP
jgi:hypothetical protein